MIIIIASNTICMWTTFQTNMIFKISTFRLCECRRKRSARETHTRARALTKNKWNANRFGADMSCNECRKRCKGVKLIKSNTCESSKIFAYTLHYKTILLPSKWFVCVRAPACVCVLKMLHMHYTWMYCWNGCCKLRVYDIMCARACECDFNVISLTDCLTICVPVVACHRVVTSRQHASISSHIIHSHDSHTHIVTLGIQSTHNNIHSFSIWNQSECLARYDRS